MNLAVLVLDLFRAPWPPAVVAALVLVAGGLAAYGGRYVATRLLTRFRFETFSLRTGIAEFLRKGGSSYTSVQLIGMLVYWGILAAALVRISAILQLGLGVALVEHVRVILPMLLSVLIIVGIGAVLVAFVGNFIRTLARNAGIPNASFLAGSIKSVGYGIVVVLALDQAGLGRTILGPMVLMLFGAVTFGAALAFGLGCKDLARQAMEQFLRNLKERQQGPGRGDLEG